MTQLEYARIHRITPLVRKIASLEGVSPATLCNRLRQGTVVIPLNNRHRIQRPCAIGEGLRTKVNANIGTSTDKSDLRTELVKLRTALRYGADTVMDLSVGGDISAVRKAILKESSVPVGTVPLYEIAVAAEKRKKDPLSFDAGDIIEVLQEQAKEGVDFFTLHAGVTRKSLAPLKKHKRIMGIVSRGGAIIAAWMTRHGKENPFYENFDRILEICRAYEVTLSLGDGLRPGSILDATDAAQVAELRALGELALRARRKGVQAMIEGPGHVPLHQIKKNVALEKKLCHKAPFYVLGPLVTDIAAGYDHISAAIGGAIAAGFGADFLCYVTASEHLRHPTVEDVAEGVIASRIAGHAADIVKGVPSALSWDKAMSEARARRDWKTQIRLSVDPLKARAYRKSSRPRLRDVCTMCGQYCSLKLGQECMQL